MITGSVGWAVGDDGAIARTADGGVNWSIPGGYALPNGFEPAEDEYDDPRDGYDIHFFDSENGMLSSDYAAVHITADGGETWTELSPTASITECPVPISPNIELWGMAFDDPNDENTVSVRRVAAAGA
jgi:photosystem II stability/assembly factor-like uncharacterized protein